MGSSTVLPTGKFSKETSAKSGAMRAGKGWIDRTFIDVVLEVIRTEGKFAFRLSLGWASSLPVSQKPNIYKSLPSAPDNCFLCEAGTSWFPLLLWGIGICNAGDC